MKKQIKEICTELNDGKIAVVQATEKLLDLFSVMNKELAFCECRPNTDIYTESVTKCNKCNKKVTTLRTK